MRLRHKPNAISYMKKNPHIYFGGQENKGKWKEIFGNNNPIYLEIGAGKGEFICQKAKDNPNFNYIALEVNTNAFVVATRKIESQNLENIRGLIADAKDLEDIFAENEISGIFLNFSTPWPKKRHHKRRLSNKRFLDRYEKIVKSGSILEMKTDNKEFFEDSLEYFKDFSMQILDCDYNISEEKSKYISEYESKFRKINTPINYLKVKFK